MASEQTALGCQQPTFLLNNLPAGCFTNQPSGQIDAVGNMGNNMQQAIQLSLLQTVLEEKIKNELLLTTIFINNKIIEIQGELVKQQMNSTAQDQTAGTLKRQDGSQRTSQPDKEHHTAEDSEFKKPSCLRRVKNETKNIPKNYGKAILSFIQKNERLVRKVLQSYDCNDFGNFINVIRMKKRKVNSIADLRSLWLDQENPFAKATRILSNIFLKKYSMSYIFNSRVTNYQGHIKYRYRLIEALREPKQFTSIKMF